MQIESLSGELLIANQIKEECLKKQEEEQLLLESQISEYRESNEKRESILQLMERRVDQYEQLLKDIASYDDFVKCKLDELKLFEEGLDSEIKTTKISNIVQKNNKLQQRLQDAETEILNLREIIEAMNDLKDCDASVSDIQMINQLASKSSQASHYGHTKASQSLAKTHR